MSEKSNTQEVEALWPLSAQGPSGFKYHWSHALALQGAAALYGSGGKRAGTKQRNNRSRRREAVPSCLHWSSVSWRWAQTGRQTETQTDSKNVRQERELLLHKEMDEIRSAASVQLLSMFILNPATRLSASWEEQQTVHRGFSGSRHVTSHHRLEHVKLQLRIRWSMSRVCLQMRTEFIKVSACSFKTPQVARAALKLTGTIETTHLCK